MISILKLPTEQGNLPIKICPRCGCTFTYTEGDKQYRGITGVYDVFCPDCNSTLVVQPPHNAESDL